MIYDKRFCVGDLDAALGGMPKRKGGGHPSTPETGEESMKKRLFHYSVLF
jgi:hypothetical protein